MSRKVIFEVEQHKIEFAVGFQGAAVGESNIASNAGITGESLVSSPDKIGSAIQLRSITADTGILLTPDPTNKTVKIGATGNLNLLKSKSGTILPASFSGSPLKSNVVFSEAYPDTNYTVTFDAETTGNTSFAPAYESKTTTGFTINLGTSSLSGLVLMGWQASTTGEEP